MNHLSRTPFCVPLLYIYFGFSLFSTISPNRKHVSFPSNIAPERPGWKWRDIALFSGTLLIGSLEWCPQHRRWLEVCQWIGNSQCRKEIIFNPSGLETPLGTAKIIKKGLDSHPVPLFSASFCPSFRPCAYGLARHLSIFLKGQDLPDEAQQTQTQEWIKADTFKVHLLQAMGQQYFSPKSYQLMAIGECLSTAIQQQWRGVALHFLISEIIIMLRSDAELFTHTSSSIQQQQE